MATWLQDGVISVAHSDVTKHLGYSYDRISSAVEAVHEHSGRYPESLAELPETLLGDDFRVDPRGRPYKFIVTEDSFRLESRGRDGVPGGVGVDTDWSLGPDSSVRDVEIAVPLVMIALTFECLLPATEMFRRKAVADPLDVHCYVMGAFVANRCWRAKYESNLLSDRSK